MVCLRCRRLLHHHDIVHRDLKYACFPPFTYLIDQRTPSTAPTTPTVTSSSSTLACKSPSISTHSFDHPSLTGIRDATRFSLLLLRVGRARKARANETIKIRAHALLKHRQRTWVGATLYLVLLNMLIENHHLVGQMCPEKSRRFSDASSCKVKKNVTFVTSYLHFRESLVENMVFLHIYGLGFLSFMDIPVLGRHLCWFEATDRPCVSALRFNLLHLLFWSTN